MNVLVTGSSGFIGRRVVPLLIQRGHTVLGLDVRHNTIDLERFSFQECNILDERRLERIVLEFMPEYVVHLAARIDLDEKGDISGYAANIQGVENLMTIIRKTSSIKRCIFTSSQLVSRIGCVPVSDEDYHPNTLYGESKVLGEKIVRNRDGGGVAWCIVRPTTVWGPGMSPHYVKFFGMIKKGTYFHVGRRPLYKSFSFIGNIAHQYMKVMEAPAEIIHRKTFYLADYQPISLRNWTNAIQDRLGAKPIRTCPETMARMAARIGDIINVLGFREFPFNSFRLNNVLTEYQFNLSETEKVCGALPYTVDKGIEETIDWLRNGCNEIGG